MFSIVLFMIVYIVCSIIDFPGGFNYFFFCLKRKLGHSTELSNMNYVIKPAFCSQTAF